MKKKKIRSLFVKIFARKLFQSFFKKIHWLSLRGMNYGGGHSPHDSGEFFFLNYVKKQMGDQVTILDVGANIGQYALLANKIFNSKCLIYSFEPTKFAYSSLKQNTSPFNNITTLNIGLGESIGETKIFYDGPGSVQSSLIEAKFSKYSETIKLSTVDEFCSSNQIKKINILKLDVEGYEFNALKGSMNFLKNTDYIQFEFGNMQVLSRNYLSDFIELLDNFKIYRLIQNGFIEINNNPINEIFQTSNYIAINKNIC